MIKNKEIVRRVTQMVIDNTINRTTAAHLLKRSVRTISNYTRRYIAYGASGLVDHRGGHYRKLTREMEQRIIECKILNSQRSVVWIRNHLELDISTETVRKVLVKHNLAHRN